MKPHTSALLLAVLVAPVVVAEVETPRDLGRHQSFDYLDADEDGQLDQSETRRNTNIEFVTPIADQDGDGALDRDEYAMARTLADNQG